MQIRIDDIHSVLKTISSDKNILRTTIESDQDTDIDRENNEDLFDTGFGEDENRPNEEDGEIDVSMSEDQESQMMEMNNLE